MSKVAIGAGAAYEYTVRNLGGPVSEVDNVISVGTTATQILAPNADRVGAIAVNLGGGSVYAAMSGTPSSSRGIFLAASGGSMVLLVPFDFTLVARSWFAVSDVNGPYNVYVLEYFRYKTGGA